MLLPRHNMCPFHISTTSFYLKDVNTIRQPSFFHWFCSALTVLCVQKYDYINILTTLRWLPVREQISFKTLLLFCKDLDDHGKRYLFDLLKSYELAYGLLSEQQDLLQVPRNRLATEDNRAFSVLRPKLWNPPPPHILPVYKRKHFRLFL